MFLTIEHALGLLEHYKYLIIIPIAILEGPIITVISGFLVSVGYLNWFIAYPILVLADLVGDCLRYVVGKYCGRILWVKKMAEFFGYNEKTEKFLENHFQRHPGKTFIIAKLSHGVGSAVQIASGIANVNFWRFVWFNFLGTIPKAFILLIAGFYLGTSYMKVEGYLSVISIITISILFLLILSYILLNKYSKKFFTDK